MKGYITNKSIGHYGRFANGLFQIAAVIGIARKQGFEWGIDPFINHDHKERFGSTEDIDIYKHFAHEFPPAQPLYYEERNYPFGYHEVQLPFGNHDIRGHFQSEKYFKHCIDEIRYWLSFKGEPGHNNTIALHYRAGDYEEGMDSYHPRCTKEYYEEALKHFPEDQNITVFSNATDEELKAILPIGRTYIISDNDYISDFNLMKNCHSFICANSSFSMMAAILAEQPGKKIIAPKKWFGKKWGDNYELLARDIYPEGSIVI